MEEVEKRAESPSSKTVSSSRVSSQGLGADSEMKEPPTKRKSAGSKRKSRSTDKENGDVNSSTNGDLSGSESQAVSQNGESKPEKGVVSTSSIEQNGSEDGSAEEGESGSNGKAPPEADGKPVNGNAQNDAGESEKADEIEGEAATDEGKETDKEPARELGEDKTNGEADESNREEEAVTAEDAEQEENGTADIENDREKENGFDEPATDPEKPEKKGFFKSWNFSLVSERKEPETNGVADDTTATQLYYSSIQGRMPLKRASPAEENVKESSDYRKGFKTPTNASRSLDDSFVVKSEPSLISRDKSNKMPKLRKFAAKRCLNSDDLDGQEDGFESSVSFNKRRKVEDEKVASGFLRSILWSPFRKRSFSDDVAPEESEDKATVAKPWFKSPFWFWKMFNKEERN